MMRDCESKMDIGGTKVNSKQRRLGLIAQRSRVRFAFAETNVPRMLRFDVH